MLVISICSFGQNQKRKCASHELHLKKMKNDVAYVQNRQAIESATQNYKAQNDYRSGNILTIPVVVHVIHNGEAVGNGQNISDAQIKSQIDVINQDYRLLNTNALPNNHAFYSVTADCEIEFCLVNKDPNGNASTGITRHNMGKAAWTVDNFDTQVKPSTAWDRTKYLNIWVTTFEGNDASTLGYATMPGTNDATDGVVIAANNFGLSGNAPFNLGRTATHEIGHYLDLAHIWGDADCGDDLVADTEPQKAESAGCPTFPSNPNNGCSGANGEMFMNYLDYSDDNCMAMFTKGQKDRMRAALTGSRASLLTANVCANATSLNTLSEKGITIYPNPAENIVNINASSNTRYIEVHVYDVNGKEVLTKKDMATNENTILLNVSALNNGFYIVSIISDSGIVSQPLTVIK